MAGYATGEVYFVSQALGFRHSHLDSGGYAYDQSAKDKDVDKAVRHLLDDEYKRLTINCMVACLFARKAYPPERLQEALASLGMRAEADALPESGRAMQALRWSLKFRTGFRPENVRIPKRFTEVVTWKGPMDVERERGRVCIVCVFFMALSHMTTYSVFRTNCWHLYFCIPQVVLENNQEQ